MALNEIVVISGKGGTGKTILTASLVPLLKKAAIADCDVDAPDLHILLAPKMVQKESFLGTRKAVIDYNRCSRCRKCVDACNFSAVSSDIEIITTKCEGCGVCGYVCPEGAISLQDAVVGEIYSSDTAYGRMVHARLIPGEGTSGKLVAEVRRRAKRIAEERGDKVLLIDGSPGIGCNVISSLTGVSRTVIVTEPTMSGLHDLDRVYRVTRKLSLPAIVVINKFDILPAMTEKIVQYCEKNHIPVGLKIPFHRGIVDAVVNRSIPYLYNRRFFDTIGFTDFTATLCSAPEDRD